VPRVAPQRQYDPAADQKLLKLLLGFIFMISPLRERSMEDSLQKLFPVGLRYLKKVLKKVLKSKN
jgi:hypothetical protein